MKIQEYSSRKNNSALTLLPLKYENNMTGSFKDFDCALKTIDSLGHINWHSRFFQHKNYILTSVTGYTARYEYHVLFVSKKK